MSGFFWQNVIDEKTHLKIFLWTSIDNNQSWLANYLVGLVFFDIWTLTISLLLANKKSLRKIFAQILNSTTIIEWPMNDKMKDTELWL